MLINIWHASKHAMVHDLPPLHENKKTVFLKKLPHSMRFNIIISVQKTEPLKPFLKEGEVLCALQTK